MAQGRGWLFGLVALLPLWIAAGLVERPLMHAAAPMRLGAPLIGLLWGWFFAAVVLGGAVGAATWRHRSPSWTDRPVHIALGLLGIGLLLAIAGWPAHRAGHWLDLGLLLIAAYALGCGIGWGLREVAEAAPGPEVARVLAEARASAGAGSWALAPIEPSPFGRPPYLAKPGREPFYVPGTGIVEPRAAAAMVAARDAAAGIVRPPPATAPAATLAAERRPYLSKPGALPFYLPGAGITDPREAVAMHPVWHGAAAPKTIPSPDAAPLPAPAGATIASPSPSVTDAPSAPTLAAAVPLASSPAAAPLAAGAAASPPASAATPSILPASAPPASAPAAVGARPAAAETMSAGPEPAPSPPVLDQDKHAGERPPGLVSARGDAPDRLQRVKGIGPQNEVRLNALGIWHFAQIASWTPAHKTWVGSYLAFPGRIDREQWIEQARVLAAGGAGAKDDPFQRSRRPRA